MSGSMLPLIFRGSSMLAFDGGVVDDPLPPPLRCLLAGGGCGVKLSSPPGGEAAALADPF